MPVPTVSVYYCSRGCVNANRNFKKLKKKKIEVSKPKLSLFLGDIFAEGLSPPKKKSIDKLHREIIVQTNYYKRIVR